MGSFLPSDPVWLQRPRAVKPVLAVGHRGGSSAALSWGLPCVRGAVWLVWVSLGWTAGVAILCPSHPLAGWPKRVHVAEGQGEGQASPNMLALLRPSLCHICYHPTGSWVGFPGGTSGKKNHLSMRDSGSIPGSGRSPGGGHSNPLRYSCLGNPMDREAW